MGKQQTRQTQKVQDEHRIKFNYQHNNNRYQKEHNKINRFTKMRIVSLNIRNINEITKRQQLARWLKNKQIDVAMLQETNKNLADTESGKTWEGYTIFYSTSIDPQIREEQEKARENNRTNPKAKAKPKPKAGIRKPKPPSKKHLSQYVKQAHKTPNGRNSTPKKEENLEQNQSLKLAPKPSQKQKLKLNQNPKLRPSPNQKQNKHRETLDQLEHTKTLKMQE